MRFGPNLVKRIFFMGLFKVYGFNDCCCGNNVIIVAMIHGFTILAFQVVNSLLRKLFYSREHNETYHCVNK